MKNHFSSLTKLVALAACALSLGSCSRSEYVMLPKGSSYHGVARVAAPVPAAPVVVATPAPAEPTEAALPAAEAVATPAAPAPAAATPQPAKQAVAARTNTAQEAAAQAATATVATAPATKLSLVQRIALNKVTRKMDKLMQQSGSVRKHDTASTARGGIDGNLRIGLILLLVGLLLGLINGLIGSIVAIIGLVFIVLWLLDQV